MVNRTYAEYKGKIYKWNELLDKLNLNNDGYSSGRIQFYNQASSKHLENLRCLIKDEDGEYVEICNDCEELIDDCTCYDPEDDEEENEEKLSSKVYKSFIGELKDNGYFNFKDFILKPEISDLLMSLKFMNKNDKLCRFVTLDKTDIPGLSNKYLDAVSNVINDVFNELNMPFQSNPNKSSTVIQIFRTGNNNYKKSETQNNNLQIPSGYIDYNPTPDRKTRTCALLNSEILQWTDLLSKYNLNHVDGRSAHTEWDDYCLHKKLPEIKVLWKLNDDEQERINEQEPLKLQKEKLIKENDKNKYKECLKISRIVRIKLVDSKNCNSEGVVENLVINEPKVFFNTHEMTVNEVIEILSLMNERGKPHVYTYDHGNNTKSLYCSVKFKHRLIEILHNKYNYNIEDYSNNVNIEDYSNNVNIIRREPIPQEIKDLVWKRDDGRCAYFIHEENRICGSNEKIEFDHIIPVSKGGSSTYRNVQILCEKHNRSKSANI